MGGQKAPLKRVVDTGIYSHEEVVNESGATSMGWAVDDPPVDVESINRLLGELDSMVGLSPSEDRHRTGTHYEEHTACEDQLLVYWVGQAQAHLLQLRNLLATDLMQQIDGVWQLSDAKERVEGIAKLGTKHAAMWAYYAGMCVERSRVLPFEPSVGTAKKTKQERRRGGQKHKFDDDERRFILDEMTEQRRSKKPYSASRDVQKQFVKTFRKEVSDRWIREYYEEQTGSK